MSDHSAPIDDQGSGELRSQDEGPANSCGKRVEEVAMKLKIGLANLALVMGALLCQRLARRCFLVSGVPALLQVSILCIPVAKSVPAINIACGAPFREGATAFCQC
jgi:hypothetical protein